MKSKLIRPLVALGAIAAIGIPVADAGAKGHGSGHGQRPAASENHGKGHGPKTRALNVKGTVTAVGDGTIDVLVKNANHHGKALRGQTVTVDVSNARIVVRDVNGDGSRDLADVAVGDRVAVHSRIAKGSDPDPSQPIVAKRVVDQGAPSASGDTGDTGGTDTGGTDTGDDAGDGTDTPPTA
ncbi:MAG: hypothetical protein QOH38_35 [Thermoleophilaceae bacterium]|jgi:hypothetical protein|nr:hypothetical protein [Thermoleophilaceae bacterium]